MCRKMHKDQVYYSPEIGDVASVSFCCFIIVPHFVGSSGGKRKFEDDDVGEMDSF